MFGLDRLAIFLSTRVTLWVSVHAPICVAHRANCAPSLVKIEQLPI